MVARVITLPLPDDENSPRTSRLQDEVSLVAELDPRRGAYQLSVDGPEQLGRLGPVETPVRSLFKRL